MKVLEAPNVCASFLLFAPASVKACDAMLDLYEAYVGEFGHHLKRFAETKTETAGGFQPGCRNLPRDVLFAERSGKYAFHAHDDGDGKGTPRAFYFLGSLSTEARWPVFFKASWDIATWEGKWNALAAYAERAAMKFDYLHAYAGFSFAQLFMLSYGSRVRSYATARYQCVDWDELFAMQSAVKEGVRSPAWLTLVGDTFVPRLAPSPAEAKLPGVEISRVGAGYAFRAGDKPILGDVNAEEDLSAYYTVGRYLRPASMNREDGVWSAPGDKGWSGRFDR